VVERRHAGVYIVEYSFAKTHSGETSEGIAGPLFRWNHHGGRQAAVRSNNKKACNKKE
jgi:hypothetical protein